MTTNRAAEAALFVCALFVCALFVRARRLARWGRRDDRAGLRLVVVEVEVEVVQAERRAESRATR